MTSKLRIAFGAIAMAFLVACGADTPLYTAGYKVVRTEGPTSFLLKASTGECIKKTANDWGDSYQRVPVEQC